MSIPDAVPRPLAVLIVDDLADAADSLAEILSFHGHAARVALDGADALRQAAAEPPDVVLLDIRMPRMDGCEVARLIRARCAAGEKRPLLVAVTGCGTEADRLHSTGAGFDLHLVKPVDPALLVGVLERYRRLLAPPVAAAEIDTPPEEASDGPARRESGAEGELNRTQESDPQFPIRLEYAAIAEPIGPPATR
jgi:CheY-like chemotaxis protein